jgi:hypothetical protein
MTRFPALNPIQHIGKEGYVMSATIDGNHR